MKTIHAAPDRKRSLIVPREHGAWGILLVPLFTGACCGLLDGGGADRLAPFLLAALALFWLRTPVESWAGAAPIRARTAAEIRLVRGAALLLTVVAVSCLIWLFQGGRNRALIWIGCAAGAAFLAQSLVRRIRPGSRIAGQIVGAAGLTSTAAAAYYVVTGNLGAVAFSLWAANLLFAANQIWFVQLRILAARAADRKQKVALGRGFLVGQALSVVLLVSVSAAGTFRWPAAMAFLPVLFRGFAWFALPPKPLVIHALGKSELAHACLFGVLLVIGMQLR
jgi:hypothetical protein